MPWKYRKLISNIGNVFQAVGRNGRARWSPMPRRRLAGCSMRPAFDTPAREEAAARAAGFTVKPVAGVSEFVGGSTWQSCSAARGTSRRTISTAKS